MITSQKTLMSRRDIAQIGGVTPACVGQWEKRGLIKAIRINKRVYRYADEEVSRLLNRSIPNQQTTKVGANT